MHQREVEVTLSGQRVAAEGHGDLLHRDLEAGRRERLDEDVGRRADGLQRGGSLRCDRSYERQRRFVRAEERADDSAAISADNRDCGTDYYAQGRRYGADGDGYSIYLTDPEGTVVELKSGN